MATSLYDMSVPSYLQLLGGMANVMQKGADYYAENGMDLADIVSTRMRDDMAPFTFQIISVKHHSLGAIEAFERGEFNPPPTIQGLDYAGLQGLVQEAISGLEAVSKEAVDAYSGKDMYFRMGDFELPFTAENFIMSFSLPNFYFHATTAYDILRMAGVPIGKMDYLGQMRVGN
jgi:hypothetical protein